MLVEIGKYVKFYPFKAGFLISRDSQRQSAIILMPFSAKTSLQRGSVGEFMLVIAKLLIIPASRDDTFSQSSCALLLRRELVA